ncbi:uncharacterized protein [Solanum lycopersicum]|uniref:uncharacterized protein n=1 Tax=Solanum lycopersicum TaxID=4081 RepID=UPI00374794EF
MSNPSSTSKQMLTALSEIEPIAFYSPSAVESRSRPGPCHEMLPDNLFEGDLPRNKSSESNIFAASKELVIESLAMSREEARDEQIEALQREEVRDTQPIFDKTPDIGRYPSSNSSDSESEEGPLKWKVERREGETSRKGKEKVVEEDPIRRPTTRSDAQKLMADALKASARSMAAIRSARTFKVSNFKMPESDVIELSSEEVEKKSKKKRSGNKKSKDSKKVEKTKSKRKSSAEKRKRSQRPGAQNRSDESVNMQEVVDNLRKQAVLAGRVFDMGIINLPEEVHKFYYNIQFKEDGSILTRVNDIVVHLDEYLLGKILKVPREGTGSVIGKTYSTEFVSLVSKIPTTKVAGIFKKVMKSEYQLVFEFVNKVLLPRTEKRTSATSADLVGTVKQIVSESTLVEYECIEGRGNPKSKITQLIEDQDQLKHEVEELTVHLSALERENVELKAKITALQEKAIKDNDVANA